MNYIRQTYRIYPTKKQESLFVQWLGANRFIWNKYLEANIQRYEKEKKFVFRFEYLKHITQMKKEPETSWLKDIPSQTLQQKVIDCESSLKMCFKKKNKQFGFPKFKSKNTDYSGIEFPQGWSIENGKLKLPKMKSLIRLKQHQPFHGKPKSLNLKRTPSGKWFISVVIEINDEYIQQPTKTIKSVVGIDVGLKEYLVTSDAEIVDNPKFLRKSEKKLKRAQRKHSKKKKGSKNREKSRKRLALVHEKIKNQRKDFTTKLAHSIAKSADLICTETLNIKGMVKNHKLAKSISDASWGMFISKLEWQCKKQGKHIQKIDTYFASSKTCSCCGTKKKDLTLKDRIFKCNNCDFETDRDLNAAINIAKKGLEDFQRTYTAGTAEINACGVTTRDYSVGPGSNIPLGVL